MERVLSTIRQDVAEDKVQIDTPTQNLESYFLAVVQSAPSGRRRRLPAPCPAPASPPTCAANAEAKPAPDKILERLAAPQAAAPAPAPAPEPAPAVDQQKLEALTKPAEPAPAPAAKPAAPRRSEPATSCEKANEKLAALAEASSG